MKSFHIKYYIMLLLGIGACTISTGQFFTDTALFILGIAMFIIMGVVAKNDQNFMDWLEDE